MIPTARRSTRIALSAAASLAAVGALAGCGSAQAGADGVETPANDDGAAQSSSAESAESTETTDAAGGAAGSSYTDGTYQATGGYVSPGGQQQVDVSLTLADGVVTAVLVTPEAIDPRSQSFQEQFASGIEDVVVGVPLDELAVDVVSGSSLTSGGFNDAVEQIKAEALS